MLPLAFVLGRNLVCEPYFNQRHPLLAIHQYLSVSSQVQGVFSFCLPSFRKFRLIPLDAKVVFARMPSGAYISCHQLLQVYTRYTHPQNLYS